MPKELNMGGALKGHHKCATHFYKLCITDAQKGIFCCDNDEKMKHLTSNSSALTTSRVEFLATTSTHLVSFPCLISTSTAHSQKNICIYKIPHYPSSLILCICDRAYLIILCVPVSILHLKCHYALGLEMGVGRNIQSRPHPSWHSIFRARTRPSRNFSELYRGPRGSRYLLLSKIYMDFELILNNIHTYVISS